MTFSDPMSAPGPVPSRTEEPTLGALVHDLSQQIPDLIRSELRLAQAEVAEKGKRAGLGIGMFSAAGLLAFFGVAGLLTTAILALDLVLPTWLAALLVTLVVLAAAGAVALAGKKQVDQATPAVPERAVEGVKEDIATIKGATNMSDTHLTPDELEAQIEVAARAPRRHRRPARPQAGREGPGEGEAGLVTGPDPPRGRRRLRRRRGPGRRPGVVEETPMSTQSQSTQSQDTQSQSAQGLDRTEPTTPDPEDPRKPDDPSDIQKRTWWYVARKVRREFSDDQCTDLAAALTYYGVLAIFPAVLALSAILGLVGQSEKSVQTVLDVISPLVSEDALGTIEPTLLELASSQSAGWALLFGAALALWSASGYVGAFGRAMNRIYEIGEGRPFWKLRPIMLLITFITIVLVAAGAADAGGQRTAGPVDR